MIRKDGIVQRVLAAGVLIALICLGTGAVAAYDADDMMDSCRLALAGNGTAGYCPGMMSTGYAIQDNATFETCQRIMAGYGQERYGYPGMMGSGGNYYNPGMMGGYGPAGGVGMMNTGFMWLFTILAFLFFTIWMIVGILAILWFMKQLRNNPPPS